jgi:hypothetical protein
MHHRPGWRQRINVPVTHAADHVEMKRQPQPTAICVIRLDHRGDGLLISLRLNADIEEASGEWARHLTDIDEAIITIRQFAETFRAQGHAATDCKGP